MLKGSIAERRGGGWAPWVVLVLGLASIATLAGIDWIQERSIVQGLASSDAVAEVERRVATSHLWLEEYVSGDQVPPGEIVESLERARELVRGMIEGGTVDGTGTRLAPLEDPEVRRQATAVGAGLDEFLELSRRREEGFGEGLEVGIGSPLDIQVDRVFGRLMADALVLDATLAGEMARSRARSRALARIILLVWVAIVAIAVGGLWTHERRRSAAEGALAESREQLLQAQKMEAVGRLAGGMAHDINNYLAAISAQCERVKLRVEPGDPVAERMEQAIETAFKASSLIRRLLDFSRQRPARREVVDLNRVVAGLEPMMRRLLEEDVRLETRLADGLWPVEIDPAQVEQVIVNLLVNAREAMPEGGQVTVETANLRASLDDSTLRGAEMVTLAVADTGAGMSPEVKSRAFEPFFSTKAETESSGLGLATVYGIATAAGGTVRVESAPGAGARVTLFLPRSAAPLTVPAAGPPPERGMPRGAEAVLLIEDNDDLRESMRAILAELGYRVEPAAGAAEALDLFGQLGEGIDLVISDVVMPDVSGPEVVEELRRRRPGLPALFVSGTTGSPSLRQPSRRGEVELLEKPFTAEELARAIRKALDG